MCKKPGFPESNVTSTYSANVTSSNQCFCTGQCVGLGYCPANEPAPEPETPQQKAQRLGVKVFEDKPKPFTPQRPNPITGVCGRCSKEIRLFNNMNPCFDIDCPAGISCMLPC